MCSSLPNDPQRVGIKNKGLQQGEQTGQLLKGSLSNRITRCLKFATTSELAANSNFNKCEGFREILPLPLLKGGGISDIKREKSPFYCMYRCNGEAPQTPDVQMWLHRLLHHCHPALIL